MSYQVERDTFISQATREGLSVEVARKLLRYATTLQRLSEAQCNGDWPYNGDRDRPSAVESVCKDCNGSREIETGIGMFPCDTCHGNGKTWHRDVERDRRHDSRYTVCPKCEASGVSKSVMKRSSDPSMVPVAPCDKNCGLRTTMCETHDASTIKVRRRDGVKVCPDCRTQELVESVLINASSKVSKSLDDKCHCQRYRRDCNHPAIFAAHFNGDPRGAVLVLSTPNYPWTEDGRGRGLYVPARSR